jgi:hypothetical protein
MIKDQIQQYGEKKIYLFLFHFFVHSTLFLKKKKIRIELHEASKFGLIGFTQVALEDVRKDASGWACGRWLPLFMPGVSASHGIYIDITSTNRLFFFAAIWLNFCKNSIFRRSQSEIASESENEWHVGTLRLSVENDASASACRRRSAIHARQCRLVSRKDDDGMQMGARGAGSDGSQRQAKAVGGDGRRRHVASARLAPRRLSFGRCRAGFASFDRRRSHRQIHLFSHRFRRRS